MSFFGQTFVKRFALCYLTVACLSVVSVCPLCLSVICNVGVLWPNGWMDQGETWHGGRPRPWPHCVTWGPSFPSLKGAQLSPNFQPMSVVAIGWMDQDATCYEGKPRSRRHCVRWGICA